MTIHLAIFACLINLSQLPGKVNSVRYVCDEYGFECWKLSMHFITSFILLIYHFIYPFYFIQ